MHPIPNSWQEVLDTLTCLAVAGVFRVLDARSWMAAGISEYKYECNISVPVHQLHYSHLLQSAYHYLLLPATPNCCLQLLAEDAAQKVAAA